MKQLKYFLVGFICMIVGVCGTIVIYHYYPMETTEKVVKEVNIHETNTIKASIDKIYDAVVVVETYDARGNHIGTGTGFVYKKDSKFGYIITNHHVIEGSSIIKISNVANTEVNAKLLGSDAYSDIAVLSIDAKDVLATATIGESTKLELGDTLFTVGSPLGSKYRGTVTKGILSGKDRQVTVSLKTGEFLMDVLQTDAAINPGNSGGPLLNVNGEVIGVTSMKLVQDEIEGMGFAIPIELAMSSVDQLEKGEEIVRPVLGVQLADITDIYILRAYQIQIPAHINEGIVIIKIEENSDAAKAGLEKGDIIIQIDGQKISEVGELKYKLYQHKIGDTVRMKIIHNGNEKDVELKLTNSLSS